MTYGWVANPSNLKGKLELKGKPLILYRLYQFNSVFVVGYHFDRYQARKEVWDGLRISWHGDGYLCMARLYSHKFYRRAAKDGSVDVGILEDGYLFGNFPSKMVLLNVYEVDEVNSEGCETPEWRHCKQ